MSGRRCLTAGLLRCAFVFFSGASLSAYIWADTVVTDIELKPVNNQAVLLVYLKGDGTDAVLSNGPQQLASENESYQIQLVLPQSTLAQSFNIQRTLSQWRQSIPELISFSLKTNEQQELVVSIDTNQAIRPELLVNTGDLISIALQGTHWLAQPKPLLPPDTIIQTEDGPGFALGVIELQPD